MAFPGTADQRRCPQPLCKTCKSLRLRWHPCQASSVNEHITLLLRSILTDLRQYNRSVFRPVLARSMVDLPTGHVVVEKTEIGHCPSVCATFDSAVSCLTCFSA